MKTLTKQKIENISKIIVACFDLLKNHETKEIVAPKHVRLNNDEEVPTSAKHGPVRDLPPLDLGGYDRG